ncbi:DNA-processing protein DprA [Pelagibacterium flavum]|uniref:DNA-processing protein DprA n=1 Tax=Pelagibacterium flavum TaxID=2984530 RepID=A0ABY6IU84_9HYPH|nr:DNA-processing protein DprA [Pelagibacterium sp. YIM 151497]MAN77966.1 DNA-protecting protein DprA [Hyphomicrobiales bacterium]UYQ74006.1 DNA-processing protein DprA [Pelagibacterium sp. YIM 151497]|tara:strand:- start:754 stop:1869 length:1116 start_codon:yes stop_codon:yes gene_type:complete
MTRSSLTPPQRVSWLRLIRSDNVGPTTFRTLINRFGSAEAALDALPHLARCGGGQQVRIPSLDEAEDEIARTEAIGARLVAINDPDYPPHLRHVAGPPPMLTVMGGTALTGKRTVGIVGARNASAAGRRMAQLLATDLGREGCVIVSGLARGIDAAAHHASLQTGTVAVMAGGLDHIYPHENENLARAIVEAGGTLVTEMPLGWEPRARDFPRRNRLVAGISLGVVIVEAAKRSGSLITARLALEQDREVFAVPGSPLDPRAEGGNHLIQQGAKLVTGARDIIAELTHADPARLPLFENEMMEPSPSITTADPSEDERGRLLTALSHAPTATDLLIETTGIAAPVMQILLLELELAGRIERSAGHLFALKA